MFQSCIKLAVNLMAVTGLYTLFLKEGREGQHVEDNTAAEIMTMLDYNSRKKSYALHTALH